MEPIYKKAPRPAGQWAGRGLPALGLFHQACLAWQQLPTPSCSEGKRAASHSSPLQSGLCCPFSFGCFLLLLHNLCKCALGEGEEGAPP